MGLDDKLDAKATETGGALKKTAGQATGNEQLEAEGRADQAKGGAQGAAEKAKDALGKAADSVKDAFK
ncbi:CsbD family protein [Litorihabitans aurantiacus]|uniref:CsbD-like domain-containing protein n=1 Tax=Litorihabitans aurantiacus TaxID=1930061 RepID=A0AA37XJF2_9MICO|nr:CsbD family protein [Litorihabitans aurantiacus]GMA30046.1 hypothetical protein GCM10025875_00380 [Litorihabitans aurantiacus]GMA33545.1 hypothetical protein GCM10025875_35370 [Litorihabitans aurantiacus]